MYGKLTGENVVSPDRDALRNLAWTLAVAVLAVAGARADEPWTDVPYALHTGRHDGRDQVYLADHAMIEIPEAGSMRLFLADYHLGKHSYLTLTSLEDGAVQFHNESTLRQWKGSSAYFNGDQVELSLYVHPGDEDIFVQLEHVATTVAAGGCPNPCGICGSDNRTSSSHAAVGRFPGADAPPGGGCTGWIISNGALLTAGHCTPGGVLEFNVPLSDADGTLNHPPPEDQYMVDPASVVLGDTDGVGNDWALFSCLPNTNTGLLPVQAQGSFFRVAQEMTPETVRVTGYGWDATPIDSTDYNSSHKTQQTATGPFVEEVIVNNIDVRVRFQADLNCSASGSPLIIDGTSLTLGIVEQCACELGGTGGYNTATGFRNSALGNAVQTFPGPVVRYVDRNHSETDEDGTIFRPYDTVEEAFATVPAGDIVSIVRGSYSVAVPRLVTNPMRIEAPVGSVTIGD